MKVPESKISTGLLLVIYIYIFMLQNRSTVFVIHNADYKEDLIIKNNNSDFKY